MSADAKGELAVDSKALVLTASKSWPDNQPGSKAEVTWELESVDANSSTPILPFSSIFLRFRFPLFPIVELVNRVLQWAAAEMLQVDLEKPAPSSLPGGGGRGQLDVYQT